MIIENNKDIKKVLLENATSGKVYKTNSGTIVFVVFKTFGEDNRKFMVNLETGHVYSDGSGTDLIEVPSKCILG